MLAIGLPLAHAGFCLIFRVFIMSVGMPLRQVICVVK